MKASDLRKQPIIEVSNNDGRPELPVKQISEKLDRWQGGEPLEITTRANPPLARAVMFQKTFITRFGCKFPAMLNDTLMRLAVSADGKGRDDQKYIAEASSKIPDAYFEPSSKKKKGDYTYITGDEDE